MALTVLPQLDQISNGTPPLGFVASRESTTQDATEVLQTLYISGGAPGELKTANYHYRPYLALFAPIRTLPREVLSEIFAWAAPMSPPTAYGSKVDWARVEKRALRRLASVCSVWHQLIRSFPTLWREIEVDGRTFLGRGSASDRRSRRYFSTSVQLAREVQLDVRVQRANKSALEVVRPSLARCKHLHIATIQAPQDLAYFSSLAGDLPFLTSLRFATGDAATRNAAPDVLAWMEKAPELRDLSVASTLIGYVPFQGMHKLRNLTTSTHLEWVPAAVVPLATMPSCVAYTILFYPTLTPPEAGMGAESISIPPTISQVTALTIGVGNLHNEHTWEQARVVLQKILDALTLPSLQSLRFEKSESNNPALKPLPIPWPHTHFLNLYARSSFATHLTSLDLLGLDRDITIPQLEACLQILPALERLAIADPADANHRPLISSWLLSLLARTPLLVPALRALTLHTRLDFHDAILAKLVLSRSCAATQNGPFACHLRVLRGYWYREGMNVGLRRESFLQRAEVVALLGEGRLGFSWLSLES
ncbi:F-box domain-containing protein [Mycena kentingensis (nom. inval.)]|nr:F-box domain-containing protein [Mycena kentingensis (nom. inval.)]